MNATESAKRAYTTGATPVRSDRSAEYEAFAHVTSRLQATLVNPTKNVTELVEAVHLNRKLWRVLATDAADNANLLPDELRAGIISLYEFVKTHSSAVLQRNVGPQTLIEINASVMRGLNAGRTGP